jgi:hypothetical protein
MSVSNISHIMDEEQNSKLETLLLETNWDNIDDSKISQQHIKPIIVMFLE